MTRRKLIVIALAAVLVVLAAVTAVAWVSHRAATRPPDHETELRLRDAIVRYDELWGSVRPAKFYGKMFTLIRCTTVLRDHTKAVREVAAGDAALEATSEWGYLSGLSLQERELNGDAKAPGVMPIEYTGTIGYWEFVRRDADRFIVRAAVLETLTTARWEARSTRLTGLRTVAYDTASVYDYTLEEIGGAWKVIEVHGWKGMEYTRGGGVHPGSA